MELENVIPKEVYDKIHYSNSIVYFYSNKTDYINSPLTNPQGNSL